jgi:hypothetical protein
MPVITGLSVGEVNRSGSWSSGRLVSNNDHKAGACELRRVVEAASADQERGPGLRPLRAPGYSVPISPGSTGRLDQGVRLSERTADAAGR